MSSIYIHIPYCKQKCSYCNFYFRTSQKDKKNLIDSILKEIDLRKSYLKNKSLNSLYFGGGTPSILKEEDLIKIFNKVKEYFEIKAETEISFECNPDDLSKEKLKILKKLGVNRLSVGIQSFKDRDLQFMNRSHNSKQAKNCIKDAQDVGFKNISIDLIFSLPNQSLNDWRKNLEKAFSLEIQHISSYSLTIEEKTKLKHLIDTHQINELDDIESSKHFEILISECEKRGFIQYEISNFGKENYFSKHNSSYWLGKEYLGIGPSAHSFNGDSRQWNISNNTKYIKQINESVLPFEKEYLSNSQKYNDYIMTSLRTIWGINLNLIKTKFGIDAFIHLKKEIIKWIESEDVYLEKENIFLTTKGKFISDSICSDLFILES